MSNGSTAPTDEKSPWAQPGFIGAAAVVALLVLLGLVLAVTGGKDNPATDAAQPASPPPATSPPAHGSASVCGLDAGSQDVPAAAPRSRWELVGRMVAPTAPRAIGPRVRDGGVRSCFAHSPAGALFASANVVATATQPSRWRALAERLLADGPGRDQALGDVRSEAADPAPASMQIAGFSFRTYEAAQARLSLAFRVDAGGTAFYASLPMAMKWERGDWKFVVADNGDPFTDFGRVPDLSGYTPWSGS